MVVLLSRRVDHIWHAEQIEAAAAKKTTQFAINMIMRVTQLARALMSKGLNDSKMGKSRKTTGVYWKWSASYVDRKWNEAIHRLARMLSICWKRGEKKILSEHNEKSYSRRKPQTWLNNRKAWSHLHLKKKKLQSVLIKVVKIEILYKIVKGK